MGRAQRSCCAPVAVVSLGNHFVEFVEDRVRAGRYNTASDVVGADLRVLEEQGAKLDAFRVELQKGERTGPSLPFDFDAFLARKRESAP
ncbi:type II toxin-antitoxin system ParD family antitoxin [Paraburkholderia caribensis]|uniref:type II toxin-antitoxin system ParD family antitoxin n=1 Tax=Paraburkholderia caribensis TaxID=75105 RepID=UPI000720256F|nr:type II toxin-antitoxin system ParD family antitoxin [Paraburkholderia caribensis]ALP68738.1 antitoxin [Paraburkholderia caribensis]AUT58106.1 type II toxin-antitoxin system ParD family antitoxin [Paraburkholderia caribensis]